MVIVNSFLISRFQFINPLTFRIPGSHQSSSQLVPFLISRLYFSMFMQKWSLMVHAKAAAMLKPEA
jgi:hypothetical protein